MGKTVHVTASVSSLGGGISLALESLVRAQISSGLEVEVIGQRDGAEPLRGWPQDAFHDLPARRLPGMRWSDRMSDALRQINPQIIHTHGLWEQPSVTASRFAKRQRIPYMVSPHGMLDPWALSRSRWKKQLAAIVYERRNLSGAACLHALCQSEALAIRAYGLRNPVAIIPNGVDLVENRNQGAGDRGQDSGRRILLFLGRIHPKKGLVNALKAWAKIGRHGEWAFAIAGWDQGGHEAELKGMCDALGLAYADETAMNYLSTIDSGHPSSVLFLGPAFGETKDALLRAADAFILPSFSEGLPMSVLEAWAYRLPVLMTDYCNLPEGFSDQAAIRIGNDVASITEGLQSLLACNVSDLNAMGACGRALVERQFTWEQVTARMNEVYTWAMKGGARPDCVEII